MIINDNDTISQQPPSHVMDRTFRSGRSFSSMINDNQDKLEIDGKSQIACTAEDRSSLTTGLINATLLKYQSNPATPSCTRTIDVMQWMQNGVLSYKDDGGYIAHLQTENSDISKTIRSGDFHSGAILQHQTASQESARHHSEITNITVENKKTSPSRNELPEESRVLSNLKMKRVKLAHESQANTRRISIVSRDDSIEIFVRDYFASEEETMALIIDTSKAVSSIAAKISVAKWNGIDLKALTNVNAKNQEGR